MWRVPPVFLASRAGAFVSRQVLVVDGGATIAVSRVALTTGSNRRSRRAGL